MRIDATRSLLPAIAIFLAVGAAEAHPVDMGTARTECQREADGRGFAVLEAGDPRDHKDGWSIAMRLRGSRGEVSTGSCFADAHTGNVSLYGFSWGDRSSTPVEYIFSCASIDEGRHVCNLPLPGQARLLERYSSAPCEQGEGWGQDDNGLWVAKGCRAKFVVGAAPGGKTAQVSSDARQHSQIECRSVDGQYRECPLGDGYTARLLQDLSGRCRNEADWGASEGLLWVNNGCHGRFERMPVGAPLDSKAPAQRSSPAQSGQGPRDRSSEEADSKPTQRPTDEEAAKPPL